MAFIVDGSCFFFSWNGHVRCPHVSCSIGRKRSRQRYGKNEMEE